MFKKKNKVSENGFQQERIINAETDFNTVETYKTIRTNIMFSIPKTDEGKVIAITSASPGEGKTTTSVNLAITFAQTGAKVILLDCDLRKSRIHRYLKMERKEGVTNILCGFCKFEDAVRRNVRDNLDVLTAGEIPLNPAELLENAACSDLLDRLKKEYDYIFIDTPPVTVVTDAVIISKQCMGMVLVVRSNVTTFDFLDDSIDFLKKAGTKIFGVIMVGSVEKTRKYKNDKYKYRYRYRYNYKYSNEGYSYEDKVKE